MQTLLRSGDRVASVRAFARRVGIAEADGDSTPQAKRGAIAKLQADGAVVAMVGDGINDGPALAQAQVSVSFAHATPLAQWTADALVVSGGLAAIADTLALARRARRVIAENLGWAAIYNAIAIPAAAFGFVTPLAASIGMSVSSLVVVSNALRLARPRAATARASDAVLGLRDRAEI